MKQTANSKNALQLNVTGSLLEAGVDEAGRGPLAGPVVAAAVVLPPDFHLPGLTDSKQVNDEMRIELRKTILKSAEAWAIGIGSVSDIGKLNILGATYFAMHQAIENVEWQLGKSLNHLAIDGNRFNKYKTIPHSCEIKGDGRFLNIAAASILAKTYRDEIMLSLHQEYPQYGWDSNKGYPTENHRKAIQKYGPTPYHRPGFRLLAQPTLFML